MSGDLTPYAGENRGCHIDFLPTARKCPDCGKRLRLAGHSVTLKLRLECPACGYRSPLLTQDELSELM